MNCPRCETPLHMRPVDEAPIHECGSCGGVFLPHGTIERIIDDRGGSTLANEVLAALPRVPTSTTPPAGQRMYVKCPACGALMNRKLFATGAGVVIDVCRADGAFFDAGELPAIVEFVMRGGLEVAARKDAAKALEARRQARAARVARAFGEARAAHSSMAIVDIDAGFALVDLLDSLFS